MHRYGNVQTVTKLKDLESDFHYCEVQIDMDVYYAFYNYNDLLEMVGKRVEYDTRVDIVDGNRVKVIATLIDKQIIPTIKGNYFNKLFPKNDKFRPVCNTKLRELKYGDIAYGGTYFLSGYKEGASAKAKWLDFSVIDAESKVSSIRIFISTLGEDSKEVKILKGMVGKYINCDVTYTQWGFQTGEVVVNTTEVIEPAEVSISLKNIMQTIEMDEELIAFLKGNSLLGRLKGIIHYEVGYHLVEMAMELYMVDLLDNISTDYNIKLLTRAVVCSRAYLIPSKANYSEDILNVVNILKSNLSSDKDLILLLDSNSKEDFPEKRIYKSIKSFVRKVIEERRGVVQDEKINTFITELYGFIDGLR